MTRKFTHPNDAPRGHQWKTICGNEVKVLLVDEIGNHIIGARRRNESSNWVPARWTSRGVSPFVGHNLIDKPETAEGWVNIYKCPRSGNLMSGVLHLNKRDADEAAKDHLKTSVFERFACVEVSAEKGSGL